MAVLYGSGGQEVSKEDYSGGSSSPVGDTYPDIPDTPSTPSKPGEIYSAPAPAGNDVSQVDPSQSGYVGSTETTGYDATTGEVGESSLAQNQLAQVTGQDSPLMQRARMAATALSNRRGLQNSSIAAGAAMGAMVDRAAPIAAHDAGTYYDQQKTNQGFLNQASQFGADAQNRASMMDTQVEQQNTQYNASNEQQAALYNAQEMNRQSMQRLQHYQDTLMQKLKGSQSIDLMTIDSEYKNLLQTNASASEILKGYTTALATIMDNDKLTGEEIWNSVTTLKTATEASLDIMQDISGIDLSNYRLPGR